MAAEPEETCAITKTYQRSHSWIKSI